MFRTKPPVLHECVFSIPESEYEVQELVDWYRYWVEDPYPEWLLIGWSYLFGLEGWDVWAGREFPRYTFVRETVLSELSVFAEPYDTAERAPF